VYEAADGTVRILAFDLGKDREAIGEAWVVTVGRSGS
jgi:hypothetical protein